jgi:hypothetical protein
MMLETAWACPRLEVVVPVAPGSKMPDAEGQSHLPPEVSRAASTAAPGRRLVGTPDELSSPRRFRHWDLGRPPRPPWTITGTGGLTDGSRTLAVGRQYVFGGTTRSPPSHAQPCPTTRRSGPARRPPPARWPDFANGVTVADASHAGAFMQIGSWPPMLTANNSYSGAITVSAGTLEATANSAATVNSGARRHQHNERDYDPCRRHFRVGATGTRAPSRLRASRDRCGGVLSECAAQILRPDPVEQASIAVRRSNAWMLRSSAW